jgi:putative ABC transport system ATP-binding protein
MNDEDAVVVKILQLCMTYYPAPSVAIPAVVDVNIKVRQGEILLISGPNGSGKTTLLSMLGCLIKPSSGSIRIMEKEVTALSQRELAVFRLKHIGFVFQTFRLLDSLTAIENVELVLNLAGIQRPESRQLAELLLEELKISHRSNFYQNMLSGGEKQRVAIARALANDPILILADEPTGSLDSHAGREVIEFLCEAAQRRNKTVIIVSHDPRIYHYANRVLHMEDGHITEEIQK